MTIPQGEHLAHEKPQTTFRETTALSTGHYRSLPGVVLLFEGCSDEGGGLVEGEEPDAGL